MTDLHSHILHDMDDGPPELGESLELCRIALNNRIDRIVATPHIFDGRNIDGFLIKRTARLDELTSALKRYEVNTEVFAGAEVFITDELLGRDRLNLLTINKSRYLLVELPGAGLNAPTVGRYMERIKSLGLIPILAHPERSACLQRDPELLDALLDSGVLLQVNADSLFRPAGKASFSLAMVLLRKRAASFLATDAHSVTYRPNNLLEMLHALPPEIDFDYVDSLVSVNPLAVIRDHTVDTSLRRRISRKRNV